ncbi:hypothetical protein [Treponema bryantii]|uniref:hypothetical protein n=1 Tax=Treponema bryantii TaxID=163 RepID=UPI002B2A4AF5|nr:hypothetical protein TRBR_04490 [Treponema bryantii]
MERNVQNVNKGFLAVFVLCLLCTSRLFAQTPSVVRNIRLPLWAELDAYPGLELSSDKDEDQFDFPISQMRKMAPFIVNGMVYGWNFVYVPYDKARGVEEYLEITEIVPSDVIRDGITYASPWISNNNLNCWVEYTRTDSQVQSYNLWASIQNPVIAGIGYGSVEKGFEGIEEAARESLKAAIRNHYRKTIKNKPKEITGSVLIRKFPTLGIDSGRYVINLDFFLECGKIIEYSVY